jgi:hypothetical protein
MDKTTKQIREVQRLASQATPLLPSGEQPRPGRGHKARVPKQKTGNRREYLVARIARDRPDILERMKAGEFASIWEAARVAGIVRDTRMALKGNAPLVEQVKRLWDKASPEERQAIRERLTIDAD